MDAVETVQVMVDSADNPWGRRLFDALTFALREPSVVYAVAPYAPLGTSDSQSSVAGWEGVPRVDGGFVGEVLHKLANAGLVSVRDVVRLDASASYLSEDRIVTSVCVLRPFVLVAVDYQWSSVARRRLAECGYADADGWRLVSRTYSVPAGCYLVAEVGDYLRMDLAGVAGMASDGVDWLFELEGFEATACTAWCEGCDRWWRASDGSWTFEPDSGDGESWSFDDAEDFDALTNTMGRPVCRSGRVHFEIY
ncbi:hypothetical protein ACFQ1S_06125 [Kibdelosporangium lantanae]|uniref:Uncharacterized protein n=1 Tax=Kibdelosporangium lantanae TaxID=1497396 RepID=A0ABW3M3F7_9PSEU